MGGLVARLVLLAGATGWLGCSSNAPPPSFVIHDAGPPPVDAAAVESAAPPEADAPPPLPTTIVTLGFDDTHGDNFATRPILSAHGMHATFYVNSARIGGDSTAMTLQQLQQLEADGNEIAGHTVLHVDLTDANADEQRREICDDRAALLGLGFKVTSFAYPFGAPNSSARQVAIDCGYDSARDLGGLVAGGCDAGCPIAETIPPRDAYLLRTEPPVLSTTVVADLEGYVTAAEQNGGGWVNLVFHHVCDGCNPLAIKEADLSAFLDWLEPRAAQGTAVRTTGEVLTTGVHPAVPGPPQPVHDVTDNLLPNPSFEKTDATGLPNCFEELDTATSDMFSWAQTNDAHTGMYAQTLTVQNYAGGTISLDSLQDLGQCAAQTTPNVTYTATFWYLSTGTPVLVAHYRLATGWWRTLTESPPFPASATYTLGTWTLPPLPADATAVGIGIAFAQAGTLTVDDVSLTQK